MDELALAVVVPTAAALLAIPMGARARWLAPAVALLSLLLALRIAAGVPAELALGGFAPPLGIRLRADGMAAAFLQMSSLVAGASAMFAMHWYGGGPERREPFAFWPLFHASSASVVALFLLDDLFSLYVALELLTLAGVGLVLLSGTRAGLEAAVRYLLYALGGSLAYLLGVALVFAAHGTLDLGLLRGQIGATPAMQVAAGVMSIGLVAKAALFPLHFWLPPAHAAAPAPASAILSALVVKASAYLLLRLWFELFPALGTEALVLGAGILGSVGVFWASLLAVRQGHLKMIIAYSTIAQLGYLLLAFPLAGGSGPAQPWSAGAWSGAMFQALSHGLAKAAMFLCAGAMMRAAASDRLEDLDGVGAALPVASFAFALAALSIMGLPPSGGFLAKYLLLTNSFTSGQWWWALPLLGGGLLAAAYVFRPLERLMRPRRDEAPPLRPVPRAMELWPLLLAILSVLLGMASLPVFELLQIGNPRAAEEGLP
jgi:multicomponent Na+:H+ antiporter subunit D